MARFIFLSFLFASFILFISPLPPAAGASNVSLTDSQNEAAAAHVIDKPLTEMSPREYERFIDAVHDLPRGLLSKYEKEKEEIMKKLMASGVAFGTATSAYLNSSFLSGLSAVLAVGFGLNFAINLVNLMQIKKRIQAQRRHEEELADQF